MKIDGININTSITPVSMPRTIAQAKNQGFDKATIDTMEKMGKIECSTCANRKYKDGSDEMVSFKSPAHVSPQAAASAVRAHEQEHVSNAYKKANNDNGEVIQASVRIKNSVCPECGRTYVSGGETTTQIKYNEENPYGKNFKNADAAGVIGSNFQTDM